MNVSALISLKFQKDIHYPELTIGRVRILPFGQESVILYKTSHMSNRHMQATHINNLYPYNMTVTSPSLIQ